MSTHYGIENIPSDCTYLHADGATVLPELPASRRILYADSATTLPELPASLEYLSASSAINVLVKFK